MRIWAKLLCVAAAPLFLTGCLWGPGKFAADLALRKNGSFVLDYRGEIFLQLPSEMGPSDKPEPWADSMLRCFDDGTTNQGPRPVIATSPPKQAPPKQRPCTRAELAKAKADHEKAQTERATRKRKEAEQMAQLFGLPGADEESNRRFAANLMKYHGWRSVRYAGKGVFDVDYHFAGRLDQDFAFPLMPDSNLIVPFITIRRRTDGSVLVTAPALTGGGGAFGARAKAMGMLDADKGPRTRAEGRFTIITDGEILTNNSEDGPAAHPTGRQVRWDVGPGSAKVPEMLVRL